MKYIVGYVIVFILSLALLGIVTVASASEWKTEIIPAQDIDRSPEALVAFMKDHGETITITGNRIQDCYGKGMWLSGYGVILQVFRKTKHPEFRAAVICQDYAGDYYVQADNKVVVAPNN